MPLIYFIGHLLLLDLAMIWELLRYINQTYSIKLNYSICLDTIELYCESNTFHVLILGRDCERRRGKIYPMLHE